ncbi:hypothetical protein SAMN05660462_02945 [Proteiniborus ethanoligenes]|uniref:Uncharacterized protein n=1 Tax=Proteiniborus ethanoligenes TaxID=415015 RepID=A0A1H3SK33_9FIRM|nr:hypothetical protein [Proteiniborus ethanoligenes]TAH62811.1 MAG: hypothetical protein EWM50_04840 [Gottschalkiaceae bacterium]SDZ38097.1 hypothetical protein SAMN05660462_02945 [Proteiniborus ethanoligenes]
MEDTRTIQEIINQLNMIEKDNQHILEHVNSIDLLLVSNENGRVKDAELSNKIVGLKEKIESVVEISNEITSMLNNQM